MSIRTMIASSAGSLPPSLARIAETLHAKPAMAVDLTISELATACGTSVASIVRFCRSLGLSGYAELRRALAAELGRESARVDSDAGFGSDILPSDSLRDAVVKLAILERLAIEETIERLDDDALARVIDALDAAERILLYGIGASWYVAADLGHKLLRIGRTAIVLSDPHEALSAAAVPAPNTVAVAFSNSGSTGETLRFVQAAARAGATTIGVTSSATARLAAETDHTLLTHARESAYRAGAMVSRIAQLAIVDAVFIGTAQRRPDETVDALQRSHDATRAAGRDDASGRRAPRPARPRPAPAD
ncbi:MurR/RpiR family transcriptional regulator [Microbacterium resistens]|uniref:MurR/RpiR family transcriptional regulator n=2 Tax=Microbacterium resistens TaxID=156977 RepID=A0ABY3RW18_9MICO|nr:MurR/RpiR family transcriptional regulator [Microbacterium resistens]